MTDAHPPTSWGVHSPVPSSALLLHPNPSIASQNLKGWGLGPFLFQTASDMIRMWYFSQDLCSLYYQPCAHERPVELRSSPRTGGGWSSGCLSRTFPPSWCTALEESGRKRWWNLRRKKQSKQQIYWCKVHLFKLFSSFKGFAPLWEMLFQLYMLEFEKTNEF